MAMQIPPSDDTVQLHRRLRAAPSLVFGAFADLALVERWLTPGPEVRLEVQRYEFRVGGRYRFAYHLAYGAVMHVNGVFRLIEPPSRIVFSWNIEPPDEHAGTRSEVHVTITAAESGSDLQIRHSMLGQPGAPERHADGWRGAVEQLIALVANDETAHDA